jgi:hypothetical protein
MFDSRRSQFLRRLANQQRHIDTKDTEDTKAPRLFSLLVPFVSFVSFVSFVLIGDA